ncbi:RtcB family protein [Candidatus Dojkabacteria bacterium]|nr:RtcB family protein [Candidatus Dojkabacteria bacterium]
MDQVVPQRSDLRKMEDWLWEIPKSFRKDMRVPAQVYTSEEMIDSVLGDKSMWQLVNMTTLPGIQKYALAMPDVHQGYGFPVGGVAAFDIKDGVISPGGIGYDINCGVRLVGTDKSFNDVKDKLEDLAQAISEWVPSGVGKGGRITFKGSDMDDVLKNGVPEIVKKGYATEDDLDHTESGGVLSDADPRDVSLNAKKRGKDQLGTLGAGNHFLDVCYVDKVFDDKNAEKMGLYENQVVSLIHTGSRGLGHQIATDYVRLHMKAMSKYGIELPDRELACVPLSSEEGQQYWRAMCAGANFAWCNRQFIMWELRQAWDQVFGGGSDRLNLVYDIAHNIAKIEEYEVDGKKKKLIVHRKGATRSFPGQTVLIPGTMATSSYVLVGQETAMEKTFGSTCHGAGRSMSRRKARMTVQPQELLKRMRELGIVVVSGSTRGFIEEAPESYKDIHNVVDVVDSAGIAKKVVRLRPVVVVKC